MNNFVLLTVKDLQRCAFQCFSVFRVNLADPDDCLSVDDYRFDRLTGNDLPFSIIGFREITVVRILDNLIGNACRQPDSFPGFSRRKFKTRNTVLKGHITICSVDKSVTERNRKTELGIVRLASGTVRISRNSRLNDLGHRQITCLVALNLDVQVICIGIVATRIKGPCGIVSKFSLSSDCKITARCLRVADIGKLGIVRCGGFVLRRLGLFDCPDIRIELSACRRFRKFGDRNYVFISVKLVLEDRILAAFDLLIFESRTVRRRLLDQACESLIVICTFDDHILRILTVGCNSVFRPGGRIVILIRPGIICQQLIAIAVIAVQIILDLILRRYENLNCTSAFYIVKLSADDLVKPVQPVLQAVFGSALLCPDRIDRVLMRRFSFGEIRTGHVFIQRIRCSSVLDELDVQVGRIIVVISEVQRGFLYRIRAEQSLSACRAAACAVRHPCLAITVDFNIDASEPALLGICLACSAVLQVLEIGRADDHAAVVIRSNRRRITADCIDGIDLEDVGFFVAIRFLNDFILNLIITDQIAQFRIAVAQQIILILYGLFNGCQFCKVIIIIQVCRIIQRKIPGFFRIRSPTDENIICIVFLRIRKLRQYKGILRFNFGMIHILIRVMITDLKYLVRRRSAVYLYFNPIRRINRCK